MTSRGSRSTRLRSSPMLPLRQICTPFMDTFSWSGSKAASVVPTAESTRPQFGSLPKMAVLNRLERATARLTVSASRSLAALNRADGDVVAGALGVADQLAGPGRRRPRSGPAGSLRRPGPHRRRPEASSTTVSLVDMQPSESARSKVTRVASRRTTSSSSAGTVGVRGEDHQHGGQARGQHAGALGHAADGEVFRRRPCR